MRGYLAMLLANIRMTVRNRPAMFWNLVFPALFILIFGAVFGQDSGLSGINVGVVGPGGTVHDALLDALDQAEGFDGKQLNLEVALQELEDGDLDVVIGFHDASGSIDFYTTDAGGPTGAISNVATRSLLNEVLGITTGNTVNEQVITSNETTYIDWFVPGILGMSIMNSGVIGTATAFVSFRERGIFRRIKVTPFPLWKFLLARISSGVVLSMITSVILVGVGVLVWGARPQGNLLLIALMLLAGSLTFAGIGYAIAAIARNTESAASYANLVTFPMMFLSGVFFPVGSMPSWLEPVMRIMPLRYLVDGLRDLMLYGRGMGSISMDLGILLPIFAVAMLFSIRFFKWDATNR